MRVRFERVLRVRCEADAKVLQRRRSEPTPLGIGEGLAALSHPKLLLEVGAGCLERIVKTQALLGCALELRVGLRHGEPGVAGELLHRFGKAQAFRLHDEAEDVAVLAGREAVIEALLVVDREGGSLLLVEGRQPLPFTPGALQGHAPGDDG